jgi:uncharacterized membrane protein YcaP (DUF421 family)
MWFDSWSDVGRVLLVGVASYVCLIVLVRVSGKRTLAQFNAFDYVVTVALGSTLATILLSSDVSFVEGATALCILLGLQVTAALVISRSRSARKLATAEPSLLLWMGSLDHEALRRHRVSREVVEQAARESGEGDLNRLAAVVLESNGRISVVSRQKLGDGSSLASVAGERWLGTAE